MRIRHVFLVLAVVLCLAGSSQAGQDQACGPTSAVSSPLVEGRDNPPYPGASRVGAALGRPPASYRPHVSPTEPAAEESDFPRYPYPAHPNPYYEGAENRNVLSEGIGWLKGASTTLVDRVSNFVDMKFFPAKPATHGGGVDQSPATGPIYPSGPVSTPGLGGGAVSSPVRPNSGFGTP
jgi:hypothetical protein